MSRQFPSATCQLLGELAGNFLLRSLEQDLRDTVSDTSSPSLSSNVIREATPTNAIAVASLDPIPKEVNNISKCDFIKEVVYPCTDSMGVRQRLAVSSHSEQDKHCIQC